MSKLGKQSKNVATWLLAGSMLVGNIYASEAVVEVAGQENVDVISEQTQTIEQEQVGQTEQEQQTEQTEQIQEAQKVEESGENQEIEEVKQEEQIQEADVQAAEESTQEAVEEVVLEEVQVEEIKAQDNLAATQEIFLGVEYQDQSIQNVSQINRYTFELDYDGTVQIKTNQAGKVALAVRVLDETGKEVDSWQNINNYSSSWGYWYEPALKKGTYTVEISSYANMFGKYSLLLSKKTEFKDLTETDAIHNTNETAQEVALGSTVKGGFMADDDKDIYKFTTQNPITGLDFNWDGVSSKLTKTIYDEQGREVGSEFNYVSPGTYYIVIQKPVNDHFGNQYSFTLKYKDDYPSNEIESNDSYQTAQEMKLDGTKYYGGSTFEKDLDFYKFKVNVKDKIIISAARTGWTNSWIDCRYEVRNAKGDVLDSRDMISSYISEKTLTLEPGDYYIVMNSKANIQGRYWISAVSSKEKEFLEQQTKLNNFVKRLYEKCFNREADESGLNYWVGRLQQGEANGADLGKFFVNSKEILDAQLNDTEYLDILYGAFFNRDADDAGRDYWLSKMNNGNTRYGVLASFINSPEYADICKGYGIQVGVMELGNASEAYPNMTEFVYKFYQKCMGRGAGQEELNYWVSELVKGNYTGRSLAKYFVFSDEFQNKKLDNDRYIEEMYQVFFERASDIPGKAYWLEQINNGASKEEVFNGFVQSDEFKYSCKVAGVTY